MNALYHAHSGLRYLVLLLGVAALLVSFYGLATRRPLPAARAVMGAFVGTLHLQVLIGVALVASGIWYGALAGHLTLMLVAAAVATVALVRAKRAPDAARADRVRVFGAGAALLCIVLGILAIGRGLFEARAGDLAG